MYKIFEQLLLKNKITAYRIAKDTGIAQSVFSSWKNGVSKPKPDKLKIIAEYFGVTVDYLNEICQIKKPLHNARAFCCDFAIMIFLVTLLLADYISACFVMQSQCIH